MAADFEDEVEFLDLGGDGGDAGDQIDWLEEPDGEERVSAGRHPRALPPRAARGRVLASVASLALVLGTATGLGMAAYHRHQADERAADMLQLAASSSAPSIPGLTDLAFAPRWHAHPAERVVIPVVNKGPDVITLVDGILTEKGLSGTPTLAPVGKASIAPGGTGELAGTVTVDCTTVQESFAYDSTLSIEGLAPYAGSTAPATATAETDGTSVVPSPAFTAQPDGAGTIQVEKRPAGTGALTVRARAASGRVGEETIFPESGLSDTVDRICSQQGRNAVHSSGLKTSVDAHTHTITVSLTTTSTADAALDYQAAAGFLTLPEAPGLVIDESFTPVTADSGVVLPGGSFTASFRVAISRCPGSATPGNENLMLTTAFLLDGELVSFGTDTADVRPLISEACGHRADWTG